MRPKARGEVVGGMRDPVTLLRPEPINRDSR